MNPLDAKRMALELMARHRLHDWTFRFDNARRRFGCCRPASRVITLSRPLTVLNGEEQVRDTILHEIAHALTPGDGHGARWKARCAEIGARPVRCYQETEVISPSRRAARYLIGCQACDWWTDRRRLTGKSLVCRSCRKPVVYQDKQSGRRFRIVVAQRRRLIEWVENG